MMLRQIKIGTRLAGGFVLMLVLLAVMTVIGLGTMKTMKGQLDDIINDNNMRIKYANQALTSVLEIIQSVRTVVILGGTPAGEELKKQIPPMRNRYKEAMAKLDELDKTETGKRTLAMVKSQIPPAAAANNKVLELSLAGMKDESTEHMLKEAMPLSQKVQDTFAGLLKYEESQNNARYEEALASYARARLFMMIVGVTALVLGILVSVVLTRSITNPITSFIDAISRIAEGDLRHRTSDEAHDELAVLCKQLNAMSDRLQEIISNVASSTVQVASAATQLNSTAEQIATGTEQVAAQSGTIATAGEQMSATSGDIAQNCQMAAEGAKLASEAAVSGARVVDETIAVMNNIAQRVKHSAAAVESLGSRSDQIGEIVGTIEDIADQTNLLALNAAIEAARAGEQGRGFAVVADEVRALAERTTKATREIGEMIKAIQQETRGAVIAMEEGVGEVTKGGEKAASSGKALENILDQINAVTEQIHHVATAAEEQTATTHEISSNMQQITEVVSQTARGAHETAGAANQLSSLSEELRRIVGQFRLA
jgi:methyl-accepting chemotaxis protein